MKIKISFLVLSVIVLSFLACKDKEPDDENIVTEITGYMFLHKIVGLWHGPVTSDTPAGDFDSWHVDFRPVSASQVSHFSLLDTNTVNNLTFFIVKHNGTARIAMRTEGCFNDQCCITYEVLDSANATSTYFRFSDFVAGPGRAHTEFVFSDDSLIMKVFTNKFNTVSPPQLHSEWKAALGCRSNATGAINHFKYPRPFIVRDFTDAFQGLSESIFYTFENDPYQSVDQPYVGNANVSISIDPAFTTQPSHNILLLFTTQSLFDGIYYNPDNLKYISKYVYLSVETNSYTIRNVHPGTYYVYSFIDINNDGVYNSGDYMNSDFSSTFIQLPEATVNLSTAIDYVIP